MMNRRKILKAGGFLAGASLLLPRSGLAATLTPPQSRGPFYPAPIPLERDADLTSVEGQADLSPGVLLELSGSVMNRAGEPILGARVEIWQCDANGFYHHRKDRGGQADPRFQGYGVMETEAQGQYRFRTIRPVAYPGRTPHIHLAVTAPDGTQLVTQMYVAGEARNDRDFLYRSLDSRDAREAVTVSLIPTEPVAGRETVQGFFPIRLG